MGCISSKAFIGEGHRLGSTSTVPTAAPSNAGQRIAAATTVATPQAPKPTNTASGTSTDGNMRSAAARAAEQRAESVSRRLRCPLPTNPDHARPVPPENTSLMALYSKHEEERTPRIQMPESYPTSCRNRIGRQLYPQSRRRMGDLPCVHDLLVPVECNLERTRWNEV